MDKTRAAVLVELAKPLQIMELTLPALKPGQVLVDLAYSGVCHTQLSEVRGRRGPDKFLPHTLGHEGSGTVAAVGEGVNKVKTGDHVVVSWIKGSGAVVPGCVYGGPSGGVNSGAVSTFMTRAVTCESRVTVIPKDFPLREAALLGCAIPTGAGIAFNTAKIAEGATVAVFGAGGIGLSAILGSALRKAGLIAAVDVVPAKLDQAKKLGATHAIDGRTGDTVAILKSLTAGKGVDVAIEAAGRKETMEAAFRSVRDGGGLCVLAGNLPSGQTISLDPMDLIKGKRVIGTWGGETDPDRDIPLYASLSRDGRLPLAELISKEYALDGINAAFDDLEAGKVARALVKLVK